MKYLDLTLPSPAANLACDEALLDACEENPAAEILRFWEPSHYFVVLGYGNRAAEEANLAACLAENVGVYRRCSGGGTVLQGPGCLNYSLVLGCEAGSGRQTIVAANHSIMERQRQAIAGLLGRAVSIQGITDLALDGMKFSGNAQRRKRRALLFHGTFLIDFDISRIQQLLPMPSRMPGYRVHRPHDQFLANLGIASFGVKSALRQAWSAHEPVESPPEIPTSMAHKYASAEWNLKFR